MPSYGLNILQLNELKELFCFFKKYLGLAVKCTVIVLKMLFFLWIVDFFSSEILGHHRTAAP